MNIKVRINKIILPSMVGLIINVVYTVFLALRMVYLVRSYGSMFILDFYTFVTSIMGILVSLLIGVVTYFICFKKKGTITERFVSGIFFPFILGFLFIITLVFFPSSFYWSKSLKIMKFYLY